MLKTGVKPVAGGAELGGPGVGGKKPGGTGWNKADSGEVRCLPVPVGAIRTFRCGGGGVRGVVRCRTGSHPGAYLTPGNRHVLWRAPIRH